MVEFDFDNDGDIFVIDDDVRSAGVVGCGREWSEECLFLYGVVTFANGQFVVWLYDTVEFVLDEGVCECEFGDAFSVEVCSVLFECLNGDFADVVN